MTAWTSALGRAPEVVRAGHDVVARYEEPHRRYHDRRHLAELLAALHALAGEGPVPPAVVCAAYFHDAVHDGGDDDEQRSAELATRVLTGLGLAPSLVAEVARLVLLTVTHDPDPHDVHGALLSDADLAVLGASHDRYARYAQDVRDEYAHVEDAAFRRGRALVLRTLLERPRLYVTEQAARWWEAAARRNLRGELSRLADPSDASGGAAAPRP